MEADENLEAFNARVDEVHIEAHCEPSEDRLDHVHVRIWGNACPFCAGYGWVLVVGLGRHPEQVTCPECAGLNIPPASIDDGQAIPLD
jgi:hypothetical protein